VDEGPVFYDASELMTTGDGVIDLPAVIGSPLMRVTSADPGRFDLEEDRRGIRAVKAKAVCLAVLPNVVWSI